VPVICVGNLVAGGAGKTPVALSVVGELRRRGRRVHVLSRGYGGRATGPIRVDPTVHDVRQVGDEALLLAAAAPTWVARDRPAGANPTIAKDLSLVVVDGGYGFGNRRVMPAGPLRETLRRGLARADAVALLGPDAAGVGPSLADGRPLLPARLVPGPEADGLVGRRAYAFAGIGRPAKFFATLREIGVEPVACRGFPDHHLYTTDELRALCRAAAAAAAVPVTTAKDWVRLPPEAQAMIGVLTVTVEWDDPDTLWALIENALADG
jgi:tetraacyldisaccharide 4'-kinase